MEKTQFVLLTMIKFAFFISVLFSIPIAWSSFDNNVFYLSFTFSLMLSFISTLPANCILSLSFISVIELISACLFNLFLCFIYIVHFLFLTELYKVERFGLFILMI